MSDPINIAFMNETSGVPDAELASYIAAYQEDFGQNAALWNRGPVTCRQIPKGDPAPAGWWQQVWLDNSDQANALGYHDLTSEGLPLGKVFDLTTKQYGQSPSRVGSHEGWEMVVDAWLNLYAPAAADGREYMIEVGDLHSLDSQGRTGLGGVLLSGVALPAAYYPNYGTRYDIGGILTAGLPDVAPADGAYLMWRGGSGWAGVAAAERPHFFQSPPILDPGEFMAMQAQHGSRRHRRIIGQADWRRSTVPVR